MPNTIKFSDNPNEETAFVTTEDDTRTRVVLTTPVDGTVKFPDNPNSTKVSVTVDGVARKAVAVYNLGGGGGDEHNLGWYATESALTTAHATATAGDWAIVGSTDTVWVWDTDNEEWVDSDQKGQVTSVNGQTGDVVLDLLPSQTGNTGKFLTTDGTDASWSDTATGLIQINHAPGSNDSELRLNTYFSNRNFSWKTNGSGNRLQLLANGSVAGEFSSDGSYLTNNSNSAKLEKFKVVSTKTLSGDGYSYLTIPTFGGNYQTIGKMCVQLDSMPTAASRHNGYVVQFVGTTDSTYTHGKFYECVSDGQDPATYSWTEVSMGGGGSSYTAGTGIDITSGVISVTSPTLQNTATGTNSIAVGNSSVARGTQSIAIGRSATTSSASSSVAIGDESQSTAYGSIAIGPGARVTNDSGISIGTNCRTNAANAIQIGGDGWGGIKTNSDANTFKVGNNNGNFEMMSADGTIPTARLTKVNTTITLAAADWSSNTQTVSVTGMTATGIVMVSPDPTDQSAYTSAGIICSAQAAGTLTFTCSTTPSADLSVNVVML